MTNQLAIIKKDVIDVTNKKIREYTGNGELQLPKNYSPENAMKAAWLVLQETVDRNKNPVLTACTQNSISLALLDMIIQGLNPAKKQCYFIAYGTKLACQRSYHGAAAVVKELCKAQDVDAQVIWKDDEFEYGILKGIKFVVKHIQKLGNVGKDPQGVYCTITKADGSTYTDIMTMEQVKAAWKKSKMNPDSENSVHSQFPEQMIRKTVINRACTKFINSSSDSQLLIRAAGHASEIAAEVELEDNVAEHANKELLDFDEGSTEETIDVEHETKTIDDIDSVTDQIIDSDTGEVKEPNGDPDDGPPY